MLELYARGQRLFECDVVVVNHGTPAQPDFHAYIGGHKQWKATTFGLASCEDPETNHFVISREELVAVRCARDLPVQTVAEYFAALNELEDIHILLELKHHAGGFPADCEEQVLAAINDATFRVTVISFNMNYLELIVDKGYAVGLLLSGIPSLEVMVAILKEVQPELLLFDRYRESRDLRQTVRSAEARLVKEGYRKPEDTLTLGVFTVNDIATAGRLLGDRSTDYDFVISDNKEVLWEF